MEWPDTTIIIKFHVIVFVRLEQWNFSLLNCNNFIFQALESGISELAYCGGIFRTKKNYWG